MKRLQRILKILAHRVWISRNITSSTNDWEVNVHFEMTSKGIQARIIEFTSEACL